MKKVISILVLAAMLGTTTACGEQNEGNNDNKEVKTTSDYAELVLGTTQTDITADLKIITNRTDLIDTVFADYIVEFNKLYPNVKISYEGITDYDGDMVTRLTSGTWGDICAIPTSLNKKDLSSYFEPLTELSNIEAKYEFADSKAYKGQVYGIPSTGNVSGIVYNKETWAEAGITEEPSTPEEFLAALQKIKDNTDATPLYTNYAAGWALTAWDAYIGGCATGDAGYMNQVLVHTDSPFSKRDDNAGPYEVYNVLYQAVLNGLTEDDPTTTDWEGCKPRINEGDIASMVLGSWAVPQMQEAGPNSDQIGYMPFPITVNGERYASASADYSYGVNINSTDDEKTAAMLYIKWLTEESGYAYDQGGVPIVKGAEYPAVLDGFSDIELLVDLPALEGEDDLYITVNDESELSLNGDPTHVARIVEAASTGSETLDDIVADWNKAWAEAQKRNNVSVNK